jgi:hypothetical protein
MLTFSSLVSYVNLYIYLKKIYIASHLHVVKTFELLKTLNFDKHKLKKYENLNVLKMFLIVPYYYKKIEDPKNYIMKTKRPFVKVVLLNEVVKHLLFEPNFNIGNLFDSF